MEQQQQKDKMTRLEKRWVLYDVGNSAFTLLISTILPIYFNGLAESAGLSDAQYLAFWGYAASFVTVVVAVLGPTLGAIADLPDMKKKLFTLCVAVGVIGCAVMGALSSWVWFLGCFIIAKIGYSASLVFYDSMLTDVTTPERMDKVSAVGYAFGYAGSCIPFVVSLVIVLGYEAIGLTLGAAMLIAFLINAGWWLCCTLPLLARYRQKYSIPAEGHMVAGAFRRLGETFRDIQGNKQVLWFLIAFFLYIDGVYTIIDMATAYGQALGLDSTGLLLALLVTQIVAFPFALLFGWLSRRVDTALLVSIAIVAYIGIAAYAIFLRSQTQFWILAVWVGMFQGGIQSLSRSYFGKIIPPEKSGEYYGLLDICGKGASFVGTFLVSLLTQISGSTSVGVMVIAPLILLGFFAFRRAVREGRKSNS